MSQSDEILSFMRSGGTLTSLDALKLFGCFRLAARIEEYKKRQIPIKTEEIKSDGKRFCRYSIPLVQNPVTSSTEWSPPKASTQGDFLLSQEIVIEGRAYYKSTAS